MTAGELAYDPNARAHDQRHQALTYADRAGWLTFERLVGDRVSEYRYTIVAGGVRRELTARQVLPYVTGQADARDAGDVIPREDRP